MLLCDSHVVISCTVTGLSPSMDGHSRQLHLPWLRQKTVNHISLTFVSGFGLSYSVFIRHYLRNLYWFHFLLLLRCFNSEGSPSQSDYLGSPIRQSADPWYSCTSPQLIAACHDLLRHSSRAIPQLGCSITCMLSHTIWVTLRYLIHANSASTENRLLRDGSPLPFPRRMAC